MLANSRIIRDSKHPIVYDTNKSFILLRMFVTSIQTLYFSHIVTKFITLRLIKYVHINGKYIKRKIF